MPWHAQTAPLIAPITYAACLASHRDLRSFSTCSYSEGEAQPRRWRTWAELMKRAFDVEVLVCPHCGGARRLISLITDPAIIHRILNHLKLPLEFPSVAPSRAPPESSIPF